tara:strand:- start:337 stop:573 length:237 start_codon:yes stop_codon:yes gene_type:complete
MPKEGHHRCAEGTTDMERARIRRDEKHSTIYDPHKAPEVIAELVDHLSFCSLEDLASDASFCSRGSSNDHWLEAVIRF